MYSSKNYETCFVGFLQLRYIQEKYCFACYFAVDLSIVLFCKSEFNAQLFVYCSKNAKPNFVRLLVRCSFQWCNLFICFLAVYQSFSLFSYALSENGLFQNFLLECEKLVKLVLLALRTCLVSMIIFLDLFSSVCIPFLIHVA